MRRMPPAVRRAALLAHVVASIGWIGAVLAYLAFATVAVRGGDPELMRAAYLVMDPVQRWALVPLAGAAALTGVVMSLGTPWGLIRHWWVIFKLLLTTVASVVLVLNTTGRVRTLTEAAQRPEQVGGDGLNGQIVHATVGLVILLVVAALGAYKPRGATGWGWRRAQERRAAA
ncbi:MAG: DUF2269 domain-containing protein [Sporichthyaceae bacterium]